MPSSRTVLIRSSGVYCLSASSSSTSSDFFCAPSPTDFSPLMMANFSLSSIESVSTWAAVGAWGLPFVPAKWAM